jgi:hypothetical protein
LGCCQAELHWWQKKKKLGNSEAFIQQQRNKVVELIEVEGIPNMTKINRIKKKLNSLMGQDEARWKQLVKIEWLKNGDKNTKFFHACANQQRNSNKIYMICDARGNLQEDSDDIGNAFVECFTALFTTEQSDHMEACLEHLEKRVTAKMNLWLV